MFCVVPLIVQLFVLFIRPQEIAPALQSLSLIYLTLGLTVFGLAIDIRLRVLRLMALPHSRHAVLLLVWSMVTLLIVRPAALASEGIQFGNAFILFLLVAHGIQTFRAIEAVGTFLLALLLFLAVLGVHQGLAPKGCFAQNVAQPGKAGELDGRACEENVECSRNGEPGREYRCERIGWLATSSIEDRVRYRGVLEDPNELSLTTCLVLPFAFALFQRRRSLLRGTVLVASVVLVGLCTIFTQSRGGQIVFLVVIGTYGLRLFGVLRGLAFGAIFVIPILALGGRSGESAEESSLERLGCWRTGIEMFTHSPLFGVGKGQFTEHHFLTAHNSYILVAAELGLPGLVLFSTILDLGIKIPLASLRHLEQEVGPEAEVARIWSAAILASMAGAAAGIFFLSLTYHPVMWVFFGLTGALATAMRRRFPPFQVRVRPTEIAGVTTALLLVLAAVWFHARSKGA